MIVCIPSHKRLELLKARTLSLLPKDLPVIVYVSTEEQAAEYSKGLLDYANVIVYFDSQNAGKGLLYELNQIPLRHPEGSQIVSMEDDLASIEQKGGEGMEQKTVPMAPEEIRRAMEIGFQECLKNKATLWGINPVCNGFYMDQKISTNLKFVVNFMCGIIVSHDPFLQLRSPYKADYERTCLHYIRDGSIVRLNHIGCKTSCYTIAGGLQEDLKRGEKEQVAVDYLLKRFPHFLRLNEKRMETSRYPELSFKRVQPGDWKKTQKFWDFKIQLPKI